MEDSSATRRWVSTEAEAEAEAEAAEAVAEALQLSSHARKKRIALSGMSIVSCAISLTMK
jgi:hypothetical protein